jgi:2-keto-4-pentenoate hydratase
MRLRANGAPIAQGTGGNCMGGALNVYRWFLKDSAERQRSLRPGDIVLTGSIALPTPMAPETSYEVAVAGLGQLTLKTGNGGP